MIINPLKNMDKSRKHEVMVYWFLWAAVFIIPAITHYIQSLHSNDNVDWVFMRNTWFSSLLYMILFWIHDIYVAPLLLDAKTRRHYLLYVMVLLIIFTAVQFTTMHTMRPPDEGQIPPTMGPHAGNPPPRPIPASPENLIRVMIALTMCGANIGIKFYFKAQRDEAQLMARERQDLKKELEFLTYQINPHFFMNTLNNIHALIDIDPEKAKNTVIELSRMMRYALYEGGAEAVPLQKELDFLTHYITLMRLRYIDNVDIQTDFSDATDDAKVPPLLLVTFVENAFKHGISYRSASYIHINVKTEDGRLIFKCVNSVPEKRTAHKPGIGLENVRKRLRLIYNTGFELIINNNGTAFSVLLTIPISHD